MPCVKISCCDGYSIQMGPFPQPHSFDVICHLLCLGTSIVMRTACGGMARLGGAAEASSGVIGTAGDADGLQSASVVVVQLSAAVLCCVPHCCSVPGPRPDPQVCRYDPCRPSIRNPSVRALQRGDLEPENLEFVG